MKALVAAFALIFVMVSAQTMSKPHVECQAYNGITACVEK